MATEFLHIMARGGGRTALAAAGRGENQLVGRVSRGGESSVSVTLLMGRTESKTGVGAAREKGYF